MTTDFRPPGARLPVQFQGNRLARAVLRAMGWRADFEGFPALQGVLAVYPHTSNWDFVVGLLFKWALGVPLKFWAKDSLFKKPVFGAWVRWLGGVPVNRAAPRGVVGEMVALIRQHRQAGSYFWLALAPEGTRSYVPGWRSGFYRVALEAEVPLGLAALDYSRKRLVLREFFDLTGDEDADMARLAQALGDCQGFKPENAAPVRLVQAPPAKPSPQVHDRQP